MPPQEAARQVFRIIKGTLSVSCNVLPPLKPNHPNQSNKTPNTDKGTLLPVENTFSASKRPILGPMIIIAANAT